MPGNLNEAVATSRLNSTDMIAARGQLVSSYVRCSLISIFTCHAGCDRPALNLLNKYVIEDVSFKWHNLGLELLEQEDEETLNVIKMNYANDVNECCKEMFKLWLRKCRTATWDQLIQALRKINLNNMAAAIEGMLMDTASALIRGTVTVHHNTCTK